LFQVGFVDHGQPIVKVGAGLLRSKPQIRSPGMASISTPLMRQTWLIGTSW
jgi:hypothetical protein